MAIGHTPARQHQSAIHIELSNLRLTEIWCQRRIVLVVQLDVVAGEKTGKCQGSLLGGSKPITVRRQASDILFAYLLRLSCQLANLAGSDAGDLQPHQLAHTLAQQTVEMRSEERRVGKEGRDGWP